MNSSENLSNLIPALIKAQAEITNATLDSKNPHFKSQYASLESVLAAVKPALNKNDLVLIQPILVGADDKPFIKTTIIHKSGEYISSRAPVIFEKHTAQAAGSGYTYARRYSLLALVAIGSEDDDGNQAEAKPSFKPQVEVKAQPIKQTKSEPQKKFEKAEDFVIKFGDDKGKTLGQLGGIAVSNKIASIEKSKSDFAKSQMATEFIFWARQYLKKASIESIDKALGDNKPGPNDIAPGPNDWLKEAPPEWD